MTTGKIMIIQTFVGKVMSLCTGRQILYNGNLEYAKLNFNREDKNLDEIKFF